LSKSLDLLEVLEENVLKNIEKIKYLEEFNIKIQKENENLKLEYNLTLDKLKLLQNELKAVKIAKSISQGDISSSNDTRELVNSLIKEIDLCVTQLSNNE
jgi:replicative DNA helicase